MLLFNIFVELGTVEDVSPGLSSSHLLHKKKLMIISSEFQHPFLVLGVDTAQYRAAVRKVHHVFRGASRELEVMTINFARFPELSVPMEASFYSGSPLGYRKARAALETLLKGGFIEPLYGYWHVASGGKGRCRIYKRTELFEGTFKLRLPNKLAVIHSALIPPAVEPETYEHNRSALNSISALESYNSLIKGKRLSLSNGGQVFTEIRLARIGGKRLYATGTYNYQGLPKEERRLLLIDGEATVELDFKAMHGNLLLNRENLPSDDMLYEKVLRRLGLRVTKRNRQAVKPLVVASFNVKSVRGFGQACRRITDRDDKRHRRLVDILGVRPRQVSDGILKAYPSLVNWVCTGDHSDYLQTLDSNIMIDALESLAKAGVVALPMHDAVIVPAQHEELARRVMKDAYKRFTGFDITVK